ncbi:MAG: PAS domain S-box protein [Syntrophorhabdales bacterium]|jgi:PAS domain S-box-containing protein
MNTDVMPFPDLAQKLIEQSPDAIVFADASGIIRVWNSAAERVFGFSENDAVGTSLDIIIPGSLREAHWRSFHRALADHTTKYAGQVLPTKSMRSDGTQIYVELSFAIILDVKGGVLGAVAHARDITERFTKERADRKHGQEVEKGIVS